MPLVDYLASKYLSADSNHDREQRSSKKRKRKEKQPPSTGVILADEDDGDSWSKPHSTTTHDRDNDDDPTVVTASGSLAAGLNLAPKKSKWIRIGAAAPTDADQAAADAILASAAAETAQREHASLSDEAPQVLADQSASTTPLMASGAAAGLQSAAQISAALAQRADAEMSAMRAAGLDSSGLAHQTIYRDASGRVINVQAKQREAAARADADATRAREDALAAPGDVQRQQAAQRKSALHDIQSQSVARHADDADMNDELRARTRWNDPMAALLTSKNTASSNKNNSSSSKSRSRHKSYPGPAEPNRYGIRPGWRWDGVDRANGFERKWFAARNRAQDQKDLEFMWQMDE